MRRFLVPSVLISSLVLPQIGLAQLTSENFIVADPVVGAGEVSLNGSSENFQVSERFITDVTDVPEDEELNTNTSGTRVIRTAEAATAEVVTETDGVRVCLSGDGPPTVYNARVLVELVAAGVFTDQGAIIPTFNYDFGSGLQTFGGGNWSPENQTIYNNNCARPVVTTLPQGEAANPSLPEVPPLIIDTVTPINVCDGVSQAQKIVSALDGRTLLVLSVPEGSLVQEGAGSGELRLRVGVIEYPQERQGFINLLNRYIAGESESERATIFAPTPARSTVLSTTPVSSVSRENQCPPTASTTVYRLATTTKPSTSRPPLAGARLGTYEVNSLRGLSIGLLVPSFRIEVSDQVGGKLEQFSSPLLVELFNPTIAENTEGLYLVTTTDGGLTWTEVPFLVEGNLLRFETRTPGAFYLWSAFTPTVTAAPNDVVVSKYKPIPHTAGLTGILVLIGLLYLFWRKRYE